MSLTQSHTSLESSQSTHATPPRKPLVLVIDPDESTRSVLEVALSRDGFDVWSAGTAAQGMSLLGGRLADVIVLESDLGGEDGFAFVAQLRGDERLMKLPVLLLAKAEDQNVEAMADVVGVDDFIQKPAYARDVAALVRVELARRAGTGPLHFDAHTLPPVQLLRALLSCPRSGRLLLVNGRAEIRFRSGKIIDARFDGRGGSIDTVVRALALTAAGYELVLEPVNGFAELQCSLREVVELVLPRLQKWTRVVARSLPLDARLMVDFSRLANGLKAMPDEINHVVQLFDGYRRVEQVLVDSPLTETLTLEVATRLYLMGVLTPSRGTEEELVVLRPMPRLFEPRASEAQELMEKLFAGTAEIRGEEAEPASSEDWFPQANTGTGLEVAEPDGGWTSAPVPTLLAEGLAPDLLRQMDAFQLPMQVEPPPLAPAVQEVQTFARSAPQLAADTEMESAILEASEGSISGLEEELNARLMQTDTHPSDRQARIDTPYVEMPQVAATAEAPARTVTPLLTPAAVPVGTDAQLRIDTPYLEVPQVKAPLDAEAAFFSEEGVAESEELPTTAVKPSRKVWPFVVGTLAVAGLAVLIDSRLSARETPAPEPVAVAAPTVVTPPASLPDVEPPEFYDEVALAAEPAPAIDISENLAEATRLYEGGQYKKAISVLEQVVVDDPKAVNAWNLLGLARYDFGDSKGARAAADQVLALDPKNGRVQILLATLHFDANEKDLGRAALEKYLELEPNGAHVEEAQALLKR